MTRAHLSFNGFTIMKNKYIIHACPQGYPSRIFSKIPLTKLQNKRGFFEGSADITLSPVEAIDDMTELLRGRKQIMSFLKIKQWRTVQKYRKQYGLPILVWANGRPVALKSELINWFIYFNDNLKRMKRDSL